MRVLGLGLTGAQKFYGLMDMPSFLDTNTYIILKNINLCANTIAEKIFKKAVTEEKEEICKKKNLEMTSELTVSGDGTWKKRGFNSLYGVSSLIGYYSGKILDVCVKSAYCKLCEVWSKKLNTHEYEEWYETHKNMCAANHQESAGKMEPNAIVEMFKRSNEKYGVKYVNYIGDDDCKTYFELVKSVPYGKNVSINKKECIEHVQKRMGTRLRNKVNQTVKVGDTGRKQKILGGKGKLTGKMFDKLTVYYSLAIRRNSDSIEKMRDAI